MICDSEGRLGSTLYRKGTAENTVLHADSFHPIPFRRLDPLWTVYGCEGTVPIVICFG